MRNLGWVRKASWILSITLLITFSYLNFWCFERLRISPSFASTCLPSIRASEPQFIQINQALSTPRFFSNSAQGYFLTKLLTSTKDVPGFQCTHVTGDKLKRLRIAKPVIRVAYSGAPFIFLFESLITYTWAKAETKSAPFGSSKACAFVPTASGCLVFGSFWMANSGNNEIWLSHE
jgi:hypothetical protein